MNTFQRPLQATSLSESLTRAVSSIDYTGAPGSNRLRGSKQEGKNHEKESDEGEIEPFRSAGGALCLTIDGRDGNTIQNNTGNGIQVETQGYAAITNNTIQHSRLGIFVQENAHVRIGWVNIGNIGLPNTIQNNTGNGIVVARSSSARIINTTISNNGAMAFGLNASHMLTLRTTPSRATAGTVSRLLEIRVWTWKRYYRRLSPTGQMWGGPTGDLASPARTGPMCPAIPVP